MIELQTSVKQDDTTRTCTPKPGYLNLSIDNVPFYVRPECGVVRSNSYLAGHFDRSLSVKEQTNLHFIIIIKIKWSSTAL